MYVAYKGTKSLSWAEDMFTKLARLNQIFVACMGCFNSSR
jgi:hypothetical protein